MTIISTIERLEAINGRPNEASTVKVADRITPYCRPGLSFSSRKLTGSRLLRQAASLTTT
jgi:hypothetical protein